MASGTEHVPLALRTPPRPLSRLQRNRSAAPPRAKDRGVRAEFFAKSIDRQIGERVVRHRRAAMISIHAAARQCGLSPEDYLAGENGRRRFQAAELHTLARLFTVRLSTFFRGISLR
jgi:hypothetical protein